MIDVTSTSVAWCRYAAIFPGEERILFCNIISEFGRKGHLDSALVAYDEAKHKLSVPNMYLHRTIIDVCGVCGDYMKSRYIYKVIDLTAFNR